MAKKKAEAVNRAAEPPAPRPARGGREIGDASLMFNGIINGQEYNPQLKGTQRIQQYDEMRLGDAHVAASLKVVKLPLLSANWYLEPGAEGREAKRQADFITDQLFENPTRTWQENLTNILLHLDYGVMPFEKVFEFLPESDKWAGKIGLHKLAVRHPRTITRWEIGKTKNPQDGVEQSTTNGVFEIPMQKMAIFVNEKEGDNWEGKSILRPAWKHWLFKDKAELIEIMAMERHGLGVPYGKTPTGSDKGDEAKLDEILRNFRANAEGFVRFPEEFEIGLLDMKANSIKNPNDFIKRCEWAIMLNVLATFMQMGSGAVGSYALFQGSNTFFLMSLEYVAKHISQTIDKYIIKQLIDYNFETPIYPALKYDKIGAIDIKALMVALQQGVQTGILHTDGLEAPVREALDLPEYTGEALVDPAMADDMLTELDDEVAGLENSLLDDEPVEDDPNTPEDESNPEEDEAATEEAAAAWTGKMKKAEFTAKYGGEVWDIMKAGAKGVPLSEETKKKISDALKKFQKDNPATAKKGKGKAGKKVANPEIAKKQKEVKALREEARQFNTQVRRELLEAKAKGVKMSPEDAAKKQLDIFNRKEEISGKIAKVQGEIEGIKEKDKAKAAPAKAKASETPESLLDMFTTVSHELEVIKAA